MIKRTLLVLCTFAIGVLSVHAQSKGTVVPMQGTVVDNMGPVIGAAIMVKGTDVGTVTDMDGRFILKPDSNYPVSIIVQSIGYQSKDITVRKDEADSLRIVLEIESYALQDVVVIGYGKSSRKTLTGAVSKIKSTTVAAAATSDSPLLAIQGQASGVYLEQTSGDPGATVKLIIRGKTSFGSSSPLYIVDGVPFSSTISNPLQLIDPKDIESLEILKDADATAIYGNRGSNGVVIITTKRGETGKLKVGLQMSSTVQWIGKRLDFLNTEEYLDLRKKAVAADMARGDILAEEYTAVNYPDIFTWDQNAYTDWQDVFLGKTAFGTNTQLNISGGSETTTFMIDAGYYDTNSVSVGDNDYSRFTCKTGISYKSLDHRVQFDASMLLTSLDNTKGNDNYPIDYIASPPNIPKWDEEGHPYYEPGNDRSYAPMSATQVQTQTKTTSMVASFTGSYRIWRELVAKINLGFTGSASDEKSAMGTYYYNPSYNYGNRAYYLDSSSQTVLLEPQFTYDTPLLGGNLKALLGATYQSGESKQTYMAGRGYPDDRLLFSASAASSIYSQFTSAEPSKEASLFSRLSYNYDDRYLTNLVIRRDGSSKFAPGHRYGTFGSVGMAWLFSNEKFIHDRYGSWLSHGKLRFSLGHTGGDGISNYLYLTKYSSFDEKYKGNLGIFPSNLANPNLHWESTDKKDIGLELGILEDRILVNTSFYHTNSYEMLTSVKLPGQTGFTGITANLDASVVNYGWELEINTTNFKTDQFLWNTSLNITIPKNELKSFEGLDYSSYRRVYSIGSSLNCIYALKYLGVDPETGVGIVEDVNKDGKISNSDDMQVIGNRDPHFYGGLTNTLHYKNWSLDMTFYFRSKPHDYGYLWTNYYPVGYQTNVTHKMVKDSWTTPGQHAKYPGITTIDTGEIGSSFIQYLGNSDFAYSDASFLRLQYFELSYQIPAELVSRLHLGQARAYLQGRNLFTLTRYDSYDPESNAWELPCTSSIMLGFDLSF